MTKVNKKLAAKMVNVGRTTFYRHIDEKGISVDNDNKIDVSELIRVYGNDKVKTPEQLKQIQKESPEHIGTANDRAVAAEVTRLKAELETQGVERRRERDQLNDEIDHLKKLLEKSMDQNAGLTRLVTDERSKEIESKTSQEKNLEAVLKTLQTLQESQSRRWRLFRK